MKILLKYIFLLLIILLLGPSCEKNIQSGNLVNNPSFENISDEGNIENWEKSSWIKTQESRQFSSSEKASSGNVSAQVINSQENHSYYSQIIDVKENSKYLIKALIKTEDVGTGGVGASLSVSEMNFTIGDVRQSHDWKEYGFNLQTGAGIHSMELILSLGFYGSLNTGTAWFDEISVTELSIFNNNFPVKILEKKAPELDYENLAPQKKLLEGKIKEIIDIFSIFTGIILFLGAAFYMVFVIHKDRPQEPGQSTSIDENLEKVK